MGIDWETGEITGEQHILHPDQLTTMAKNLEVGGVAYIDASCLSADEKGALWLDPDADTFFEAEADDVKEGLYLCRVIRIKDGFIVDASAGDFILDVEESDDTIAVNTRFDHAGEGWFPVIGLVGTDMEREELGKILFREYDIVLDRSVLMPPFEPSSEDGFGSD
ncbi:MAG TPA: hypothetical protein VHA05_02825 [Candidatus Saccharimonadales bacterium]|nr:hypothetical protein [Candidatus Saccharimonadales bacterium]